MCSTPPGVVGSVGGLFFSHRWAGFCDFLVFGGIFFAPKIAGGMLVGGFSSPGGNFANFLGK